MRGKVEISLMTTFNGPIPYSALTLVHTSDDILNILFIWLSLQFPPASNICFNIWERQMVAGNKSYVNYQLLINYLINSSRYTAKLF